MYRVGPAERLLNISALSYMPPWRRVTNGIAAMIKIVPVFPPVAPERFLAVRT